MRTLIILFMICSCAQNCFAGIASPFSWEGSGFRNVWLEGGYNPRTSAASAALGIRFVPKFAIVLGYANDQDYNSDQVLDEMPFGINNPLSTITATPIGRKRINGAYGFDLFYFLNPSDNVSIYFGPGMYYQEWREVAVVTAVSPVGGNIGTAKVGDLVSTTSDKNLEASGGAGIQWQVHKSERYGLVLTAGYHYHRGFAAGIGMSW